MCCVCGMPGDRSATGRERRARSAATVRERTVANARGSVALPRILFVTCRRKGLNPSEYMDLFANWLWMDHKFLGIDWGLWKIVGWLGNAVFFSRFFVQWWATEKHKR